MPKKESKVVAWFEAFEQFAIFTKKRWRATIIAITFLTLMLFIGLTGYYLYIKIKSLEAGVTKSIGILEEHSPTSEDLQEGLKEYVQSNLAVEKELGALMNSNGADRALLFRFHNSKTDLLGRHFYYYSNTNEVLKTSRDSHLNALQNIPIMRLGDYMNSFLNDLCVRIKVSNLDDSQWLKGQFITEGIAELFSYPVYDLSGEYLLGFVELVYNDPIEGDAERIKQNLRYTALKISASISDEVETTEQ